MLRQAQHDKKLSPELVKAVWVKGLSINANTYK